MTDEVISPPTTITEAISAVAASIGAIDKNGAFFMKDRGKPLYRYLKHEDILAALMPLLHAHGLTIVPHAVGPISRDVHGGMTYVWTTVTYRISHTSGAHQDSIVMAEAADKGDKASAKLMTSAHKALVKQVFGITDSEAAADIEDDDLPVAEAAKKEKITQKYIDPITEYGNRIMGGDESAVGEFRSWFVRHQAMIVRDRTSLSFVPFWSDTATVGTPLTYMSALSNLLKRWKNEGGDLAVFAEKNKNAAPWV